MAGGIAISFAEAFSVDEGTWFFLGAYLPRAGEERPDRNLPQTPPGGVMRLQLRYDERDDDPRLLVSYDNDARDDESPIEIGPLLLREDVRLNGTQLAFSFDFLSVINTQARADGLLRYLSILPLTELAGDFDGDGLLARQDVDWLQRTIVADRSQPEFDLTGDDLVNKDDVRFWVTDLKHTYFGDANLDGEFASSDLVNIFVAGEYEDDIEGNSTWAEGDWDSDGDFTSSDLVLAFVEGGYEQGPRAAVPEPAPCAVMLGIAMLPRRRR